MGPDRAKHLRNAGILVVLALVVWLLPGGETGAATIANLLSILFLGGLAFLAYRLYMEHRSSLFILEDRQRGLFYGCLAVIAIALIATRRLWDLGGLGALAWLALLGAAAYGLLLVWRAWRAY